MTSSPHSHGSRRGTCKAQWVRKNGRNDASWNHRVNSSGDGVPVNPPMSEP